MINQSVKDKAHVRLEVELIAYREGTKLAVEWTPLPAILESDCLTAVMLLRRLEAQKLPSTFIIKETVRAAEGLPSISFNYVKRTEQGTA